MVHTSTTAEGSPISAETSGGIPFIEMYMVVDIDPIWKGTYRSKNVGYTFVQRYTTYLGALHAT